MHYSVFVQDGDKWVRVYTHTDPVDVADAFLKATHLVTTTAAVVTSLERLECVQGYDRNGNHGLVCAEQSPYRPAKVVTR